MSKTCICLMGNAAWIDTSSCTQPPPPAVYCQGIHGGKFMPGEDETIGDCPMGQIGSPIKHTCQNDGNFGSVSLCKTPPPTCVRFTDGKLASVGDVETLACPAPTTIGFSSHTCQANGWTLPLDVSGCRLPPAGADGKCRTAFAEIATCPSGQTCGKCLGPAVQRPASCVLFGIDCPNETVPSRFILRLLRNTPGRRWARPAIPTMVAHPAIAMLA